MTLLKRISGAACWRGLRPASRFPLLGSVAARCTILVLIAALAIPVFAQVAAESPAPVAAQAPAEHHGGEANLVLPDLDQATFLGGIGGRTLLMSGCCLRPRPAVRAPHLHPAARTCRSTPPCCEVSELIYETCKTYLITQGKFLMILEVLYRRHHRFLLRLPAAHGR